VSFLSCLKILIMSDKNCNVCGALSILICCTRTDQPIKCYHFIKTKMSELPIAPNRPINQKLALVSLLLLRRQRRKIEKVSRSCWVKPWIKRRKELGVYTNLIKELESEDPERFRQFHRLDVDQFKEILYMVGPLIQKGNLSALANVCH